MPAVSLVPFRSPLSNGAAVTPAAFGSGGGPAGAAAGGSIPGRLRGAEPGPGGGGCGVGGCRAATALPEKSTRRVTAPAAMSARAPLV